MSAVKESKNQIKGRLIVYVGYDDGYFDTIKGRYHKQLPKNEFTFHQIKPKDEKHYQKIFVLLAKVKPGVIYLDFSKHRKTQLKLAQLLTRENATKTIPIVGLVETKANVRECISSGVTFTHVKCGEYYDVVYDPFVWAYPKEVTAPNFAKAKFTKEADLIDDFRIGYITKDAIHAEGNIELKIGEKIRLDTAIPKSSIPSKHFIVKNVVDHNLYYDFKYAYELEFVFVDEPALDESHMGDALGEADAEKRRKAELKAAQLVQQAKQTYLEELRQAKKKHLDWLKGKVYDSQAKKTKILVVDPGFMVLQREKLLDEFPFTIRTQSFLSETMREINMLRPNIIAFQFIRHDLFDHEVIDIFEPDKVQKTSVPTSQLSLEEKEVREKILNTEKEKSRTEFLRMMNMIHSLEGYKPFIIVFNCFDYNSKYFQENFKYPLILTHPGHPDLDAITKMATVFENKQDAALKEKIDKKVASLKKTDPNKYRRLSAADFAEEHVYIKKDDLLSYGAYTYPIEIETMNESELTFNIDTEIDLTSFRMSFPVEMAVTLIPDQGKKFQTSGKKLIYKALIHSVDENDKKTLRKHINEIFFDPLKKERAKEEEAFKKVNEEALKKRREEKGESDQEKDEESDQEAVEGENSGPGDAGPKSNV